MKKAPKKLSQAIMLALNDLALVEQDSRYKVKMDEWHIKNNNKCEVCFAGSVMAKTCEVPLNELTCPSDFSADWNIVFRALNYVRLGEIHRALNMMYLDGSFGNYYELSVDFFANNLSYENDTEEFKNAMLDVAMMLKVNGY